MSANQLSVSRIVNVQIILTPQAAQGQNLSTGLILGSSTVIDVVERMRSYNGLDAVAAEFGTSAPEYKAAQLYFGQSPKPTELLIGRWVETASAGQLVGAILSTAQRAMAVWTAVVNGGFKVEIDGVLQPLTGLDFSGETNLNGVASVINGDLSGASVAWDAIQGRFVFTSDTTGGTAPSSVSFLTPPAGGTNIAGMLKGLSTDSGAYVADGVNAETPVDCVAIFDERFGKRWYGVLFASVNVNDDETLDVSAFIESTTTKHIYGVSTQQAGVLVSAVDDDIASKLKDANVSRTLIQFSSSNPYVIASFIGRLITVDYNGNFTVITMMFKQEPTVAAENLTASQADSLAAKNCNAFVVYDNNTAIVQHGVMCNGDFADIITGTDWFATDMQTEVYNTLYTSPTKIPQTDGGNQILGNAIARSCDRSVNNGLVAPGQWNSAGFGAIEQGQFLDQGYYIYIPPISSQSQGDREARKSVTFQVAAKLAGAIQSVDILVNVNR